MTRRSKCQADDGVLKWSRRDFEAALQYCDDEIFRGKINAGMKNIAAQQMKDEVKVKEMYKKMLGNTATTTTTADEAVQQPPKEKKAAAPEEEKVLYFQDDEDMSVFARLLRSIQNGFAGLKQVLTCKSCRRHEKML